MKNVNFDSKLISDLESFSCLNEKVFKIFNEDNNIEIIISSLLHELGVPSHIKGYQYIRDAVSDIYKKNIFIKTEVYSNIALKYETNKSRIERSIRHAIETGWNRGNYKFIEEIFGHSIDLNKSKPTNLEFIFTLADKIRLEEQKYLKKFCNQIDFN